VANRSGMAGSSGVGVDLRRAGGRGYPSMSEDAVNKAKLHPDPPKA